MRRLVLTLAVAAVTAVAPVAAVHAFEGHGRGGGGPRREPSGGWGERPGPRWARPEPRFDPPRRFEAPRVLRPGGFLPGGFRDDRVEDYGRYRLRPPPQGYHWYRVGDGFLLVSPDGQIFDMVVD